MKIIAIEEHASDQTLAAAVAPAMMAQAPYLRNAAVPGYYAAAVPGAAGDTGEKRLADMDANGIDIQVLSGASAPQLLDAAVAVALVRDANNSLAERVGAHPDRFAAFATLPLSDPDAAAAELARTVKELGFKGALIAGRPSPEGIFLDDPRYAPVLQMASDLGVPIYIHPGPPHRPVQEAYYSRLDPVMSARLSAFGWGWHAEAGVQVIRMILAGVFDRHPNLQIIAGHWGEMVPFFLARLDAVFPQALTHLGNTVSGYFKEHVYITPSGIFDLPSLKFALDVLGADRIIFSVDYPFIVSAGARAFLENAPISQEDKEKIAHGNAEKLLNL